MRLCLNGKPNPCDANAECIVERDGSISCMVRTQNSHTHTRLDCELESVDFSLLFSHFICKG